MNSSEQHRLYWLFERVTPAVAVVSVAVGVLVLLGWLFDLEELKSVLPGLAAMKPNAALGFILSGVALWEIQTGGQGALLVRVSQLCAGVVVLLGLLTLGEYLSGMDFGIDQLLIQEVTSLPGDIPGRLPVNAALSFAATGATLLLLSIGNGRPVVTIHVLTMIPFLAAVSALICYCYCYGYGIDNFLREQLNYTPMAINSATVFVLLALGFVNARPEYPFRRFMTSDSTAGIMVRCLLPAATGFSLVTGWLIQYGHHTGYFREPMVPALFTATSIAGLGVLILWNAGMLYEADAQRERAEKELGITRRLLEASLDPLVMISPDGYITDVNEATVKSAGVARETLIGSDFSEYFTEPDKARAGYQEVFAKGLVTDYPLTLRHVSGTVMEVLFNASVYRNEKGEVAGVFAAARNITERKRAEEELFSAGALQRAIFNSANFSSIATDAKGVIQIFNVGAEHMLGYTAAEVMNKITPAEISDPQEVVARAAALSLELDTPIAPGFDALAFKASRGIEDIYELTYIRKDGSRFPAVVSVTALRDAKNEIIGYLLIGTDNTVREEANAQIKVLNEQKKMIVDACPAMIFYKDVDNRFISVNEAMARANRKTKEEMEGASCWDLYPRAISDLYWQDDKEVISTGQPKLGIVESMETPDGTMFVQTDKVPVRDAQGTVVGIIGFTLDITARKLAEEALLKASALQNAIFNSANFSSIATDAKGVIQIFNVGAERMLGYTATEVMNKITPAEISDPQEVLTRAAALSLELDAPIAPGFDALVYKASRGIEDIYELTYIRKDGSRFPAVVSVTALRDAQNEIIGYLLIGTDNTARKLAEEALLKAGALQNAIFNSANFSSIATDAKGVIQIFNVGAERMLGYTATEVMNKITPAEISDPQEVLTRAAALSLELDAPIAPGFDALVYKASRGIEDIYELTYIRKDGSRFPAVVSVTALRDAKNEIIGYLLIGTDNTARKHIEERLRWTEESYRLMVESVTDYAIIMLDVEGRIVSWNKGAQRIKGYSTEEIVGQHFSLFYSRGDIECGKPQQDLNIVTAKGRFEDEGCWRVRKDGSTFLANVIYTAIRDEGGNLRGYTKLIQDMTERKRLDQLLKEKNAALETANKDLEGFAYSVSHDLRVPLRAIDGFSQQVLKHYADKLDDEGKRYLNVVRDNTKKMSQLIDDILAFSRMGRLGLSVSEVNMEELVREVFEELKPASAERELTIEIKPLPLCHGDPSMLRQVLVNLLGNAIKFTQPKDAALIEVGGRTESAENIYYINDNGAGFDMQYTDKLFGVFQRLHGVAEFEGTGIGLAIVKRIITRHGGRVWAEGKVDEGATFYFTLPDKRGNS